MSQQLIRLLMNIVTIGRSTEQSIEIHFDDGAGETIHSVPLESTWNQFIDLLQRSADETLFWSNPMDWKKHRRNTGGTAMCTDEELTKMLDKALEKKWEWVQVYDSEGQFPDDPDG
jgi:hypothetical protein